MEWMRKNGALISEKMEYPVVMGDKVGVMATEDISDREAVLAIPSQLVINHTLVMQGELRQIFQEKEYFFNHYEPDAHLYVLVLFVVYEKLKGE